MPPIVREGCRFELANMNIIRIPIKNNENIEFIAVKSVRESLFLCFHGGWRHVALINGTILSNDEWLFIDISGKRCKYLTDRRSSPPIIGYRDASPGINSTETVSTREAHRAGNPFERSERIRR